MTAPIRLQGNRFELKYVINEQQACGVRSFVRGYLTPDEHADPRCGNSYPVYSLYLDSPGLILLQSTKEGQKNRFKLRIRFYDEDPAHPAFLEVKRRIGQVIQKERATVTRSGADRLLSQGWAAPADLFDDRPSSAAALNEFCSLAARINAEARTYVRYDREAYVSPASDQIRVTFDRNIQGEPFRRGSQLASPTGGIPIASHGVVLELKFTDRFPAWMRELVHAFGLGRVSFAKYVQCADAVVAAGGRQKAWQ